jgi:thymidine kinase
LFLQLIGSKKQNTNPIIIDKKKKEKKSMETSLRDCLIVNIGPMQSSKTQTLVNLYEHMLLLKLRVLVLCHTADTRSTVGFVETFDKRKVPCVRTSDLFDADVIQQCYASDVILLDEAQFFDAKLVEFCQLMVDDREKCVHVFGLHADADRGHFGYVNDLIPHADHVIFHTGLCLTCKTGKRGIFTRYVGSTEKKQGQVLVGTQGVEYVTECRRCYNSHAL